MPHAGWTWNYGDTNKRRAKSLAAINRSRLFTGSLAFDPVDIVFLDCLGVELVEFPRLREMDDD